MAVQQDIKTFYLDHDIELVVAPGALLILGLDGEKGPGQRGDIIPMSAIHSINMEGQKDMVIRTTGDTYHLIHKARESMANAAGEIMAAMAPTLGVSVDIAGTMEKHTR